MLTMIKKLITLICTVLIAGCDAFKEKEYPKVLRLGDSNSLSNYVFENTKDNIGISPSNMHPELGGNVSSWISVHYPKAVTGREHYFSVNVSYIKSNRKYKDEDSIYYQKYTNPAVHKHEELFVPGLENKTVIWYETSEEYNRNHENYTIDHKDFYDHIFISRRKNTCRVRTLLKENVELDFHFKKEKTLEDDLRLIDFVITNILFHIKPVEVQ